ncbi:MAG TPA: hypothetical protein VHX38_01710 [Pseudonocardiaceae bacterium]|nr:hypothetical protein [Pseudonocardiaceae bacterium]
MRNGKLIPAVLVLSHEEQLHRLARSCPPAVSVALVAGDPCFDRILLSRGLRASYRDGFGLTEGQRLVVISSTWGPKSLYGQHPELPVALAEQLPLDEYRIALVLHPNIWYGHSRGQLDSWLAGCARAGITIIAPEEGWRAALVAADLVVGDYGSVSFYAVAQGAPLLLAAHPAGIVDAESPIAALLATAPRLDPKRGLREQVEECVSDYDAERYRSISAQTTSAPGRAAQLLRSAIYRELRLSEPAAPASTSTVPLPAITIAPIGAQLVGVAFPDGMDLAEVRRFPAEVLYRTTGTGRGRYLVVGTDQPRQLWLERADALLRDTPSRTRDWMSTSLAALPGCLVAAEPDRAGRWLVGDRAGRVVRFDADDQAAGRTSAFGACCAAVVCAWSAAGLRWAELPKRLTITRNGLTVRVSVAVQDPTGRADDVVAPPVR